MSVREIKAGKAYVELGVNNKALLAGLKRAQQRLNSFANSVANIGTKIALLGGAMATPFALAIKSMSDLEYEMANLQGAANPTIEEFNQIRKAISRVSASTGMLEKDVAKSFNELIKAGMPVTAVINGMGAAAVKFAEVGGLDFERAAVTMTNAVNLFGTEVGTASKAIDMLSAAADASTTDINYIAWSFQMSSAVFKQANQSLRDLTASIAIMANEGIKGSDAGTSLKSMMLSLMAPTDQAAGMMKDLGIDVRDANREMRPMIEIIDQFRTAMGDLNAESRDDVFKRVFGTDAIRAASIILAGGTQKFQSMIDAMTQANTVAQKFDLLLASTRKQAELLFASVSRLGVAVGEALAPSVKAIAFGLRIIIDQFKLFVDNNKKLVIAAASVAGGLFAFGTSLIGLGIAAKVAAGSLSLMIVPMKILGSIGGIVTGMFLKLLGAITSLMTVGLVSFIGSIVSAVGSLVGLLAIVATSFLSLYTVVGLIAPVLGLVISRFIDTGKAVASIASAVNKSKETISDFGTSVGNTISDVMSIVGEMAQRFIVVGATFTRLFSFMSESASMFGSAGRAAYNKIVDAFKSGNVEAAAKVMWASLKFAWEAGSSFLSGIWDSTYTSLMQTAFTAWAGVVEIGESAFTAIANGWDWLMTKMQDLFGSTMTAMQKGWAWLDSGIQIGYTMTEGFITGRSEEDTNALLDAIEKEREARYKRFDKQGAMSPEEREAERIKRQQSRTAALSKTLADNKDLLDKRVSDLAKANEANLSASAMELLYAKQALEESLATIDTTTAEATEFDFSGLERGIDALGDGIYDRIGDAARAASAAIEARGTFDTNTLNRIGFGQEMVDIDKKNNELLKKIEKNTREQAVPTFR